MFEKNFMNISEFADLTGTSRRNLLFYDEIGLFSPESKAENGYRRYSYAQIKQIGVIASLAELGIPLKEIKTILQTLSPQSMIQVFERQKEIIREKIERLLNLQHMLETRIAQTDEGLRAQGNAEVFLMDTDKDIPLYVSENTDSRKSELSDKQAMKFYHECQKKGFSFGSTFGFVVDGENLKRNVFDRYRNICFRVRDFSVANACMPKGRYAVCYAGAQEEQVQTAYSAIFAFLRKNGLSVAGDAFEDYFFDEVVSNDPDEWLVKIAVNVKSN